MSGGRLEVTTGRIGELLAAAIIENLGWQTALCQQSGVDLILWKDNLFYRCQVKSSGFHKDKPNSVQFHFGIGGKKRLPTKNEYDLACLVSVEQRRAFFLPIFSINQTTMRRSRRFFENPDLERDTFDRAIGVLNEFHRGAGGANHRT